MKLTKYLSYCTLILLIFLTNIAHAGFTGPVTLNQLYTHSTYDVSGVVFVYHDGGPITGCSQTDALALKLDNPAASEIYSALLAAAAMNKQVNLSYSGCTNNGNYPKLNHIILNL